MSHVASHFASHVVAYATAHRLSAPVAARRTFLIKVRKCDSATVGSGIDFPNEIIPDADDVAGMELVLDAAEIFARIGGVFFDGTAGKYLFAPDLDRYHDSAGWQLEARWCGLSDCG